MKCFTRRCRDPAESETVQSTIRSVFKVSVGPEMFSLSSPGLALAPELKAISDLYEAGGSELAPTSQTLRTMALTLHSFRYGEPVLLIGDTGLGKTSVAKVVAEKLLSRRLLSFSCHLNTDASDFLGSLRPARDRGEEAPGEVEKKRRLFEWQDGPLVRAMTAGEAFLIDEISLADDSVLERMNSVLEAERTLVLPERGDGQKEIMAHERCVPPQYRNTSLQQVRQIISSSFRFLLCATMNPSGDFGKKELSPALRNRFAEIWCSSEHDRLREKDTLKYETCYEKNFFFFSSDCQMVLDFLLPGPPLRHLSAPLSDLVMWLNGALRPHLAVTFRDLRTLSSFIKVASPASGSLAPECAVVHGICLIVADGLEMVEALAGSPAALADLKNRLAERLNGLFPSHDKSCGCLKWVTSSGVPQVTRTPSELKVGEFTLPSDAMEQDDGNLPGKLNDAHFQMLFG